MSGGVFLQYNFRCHHIQHYSPCHQHSLRLDKPEAAPDDWPRHGRIVQSTVSRNVIKTIIIMIQLFKRGCSRINKKPHIAVIQNIQPNMNNKPTINRTEQERTRTQYQHIPYFAKVVTRASPLMDRLVPGVVPHAYDTDKPVLVFDPHVPVMPHLPLS